jgi:hypothetical protein
MNRSIARVLLVALLVSGGCTTAASSPSPAAEVTPGEGDVSSYFSIEEVGLGENGYITLRNYTDVSASLDKVFLCQAQACVDLPDVVIGPGEIARVAVGDGAGLEDVVVKNAALQLTPADGEVAVYRGDDRRDPGSMRYYVQWGSTPHELTDVAITAGLSGSTTFAPSGPNATRLWKTEGGQWVWDAK